MAIFSRYGLVKGRTAGNERMYLPLSQPHRWKRMLFVERCINSAIEQYSVTDHETQRIGSSTFDQVDKQAKRQEQRLGNRSRIR